MAQQDTGLGWSAKEEWLLQSSGILATLDYIGGASYPGQPLPHATTAAELLAGGYKAGINNNNGRELYVGCDFAGKGKALVFWNQQYQQMYFIQSKIQSSFYIHYLTYSSSYSDKNNGSVTSFDQTTGLYYGALTRVNNVFGYGSDITPYCPSFPNVRTALDAVETVTETFSKTNPGYAVAGVIRWNTGNSIIDSPVLISSVSTYTDMESTNPNYNIAKLNVLKEGINFYMSFFDIVGDRDYATLLEGINIPEESPVTLPEVFEIIASVPYSNISITDVPDPYDEPPSEEGGGDGDDDDEDDVDFTDPPSTSIGATGFLTIFTPSLGQLRNLATFMWNTFDIDNWRRLFANPMDAILGLHIIPVPPTVTGTKTVKVAGISTEIEMDYTTVRYIRRPMGTCEIPKKWGAYLDYNPYTKIAIFLPYIGFKDIDADDIMGETIALQYMVDILTGACVAELKCGDTVLYSWQGNCANEVPITGSDWRGAIASALGIAGSIAATALTGGASAPMIAGTIASVGANSLNLKPSVNRSGAIAGSAGFAGAQRPYIIRTVPNLVIPADQNKMIGYPSFVNASLGSLTGYNEISAIHLEGIPATGNELSEIETLLKGGVIF